MHSQEEPYVETTAPKDVILFTRGNPDTDALPIDEIARCATEIFKREGRVLFQYGHYSGYGPLRQWIAEHFGASFQQVLVGNSSMEFLSFIGGVLLKSGDTVWLENPSYDRAITAMRRQGAQVVGLALEADGVNLEALEAELRRQVPKFFYLVPEFQNPSGVTTSLAKRRRIAELAQKHGFYIIEDAPYRRLRYRGEDLPTLRELAPERTLHVCSFSKLLSPGLRVGFLIGPENLMPALHKWSEDTYIHPTLVSEGIVYEYCRRGLLEPNIEKLKGVYRPRMQAMLSALRSELPQAQWAETDGGFFIGVRLPQEVDGNALRANAPAFGIVLADGRGFFTDDSGGNFVRLPFCGMKAEESREGIRRLAAAVARCTR
jgi:DNA-binding transcriptional MocR family regulator